MSDTKLTQLEHCFESRLIELSKATDGAGLKVMIRPAAYTANNLREKIVELLGSVVERRVEYRGEEALARNIELLANAWEAAVRYEDFQRELAK